MNAPDERAVAEEQARRQRERAIEIIADAMDEYDMDYERMTEQPTAGADAFMERIKKLGREPINETEKVTR